MAAQHVVCCFSANASKFEDENAYDETRKVMDQANRLFENGTRR